MLHMNYPLRIDEKSETPLYSFDDNEEDIVDDKEEFLLSNIEDPEERQRITREFLRDMMVFLQTYNIYDVEIHGIETDKGRLSVQFRFSPQFLANTNNIEMTSVAMVELFQVTGATNSSVWIYMRDWDNFY